MRYLLQDRDYGDVYVYDDTERRMSSELFQWYNETLLSDLVSRLDLSKFVLDNDLDGIEVNVNDYNVLLSQ